MLEVEQVRFMVGSVCPKYEGCLYVKNCIASPQHTEEPRLRTFVPCVLKEGDAEEYLCYVKKLGWYAPEGLKGAKKTRFEAFL